MKLPLTLMLLAILAAGWDRTSAAADSTNTASTNRILIIDPSVMPVAGGTATLTIGPLLRADGIYSGDYTMKVSPYFYKNEKGRLAIVVSDESLATIGRGKVAAIIGTATTAGKSGTSRHIDATATPADTNHGSLKLWFIAGDRKMTFEPAYHFAAEGTATASAPPAKSSPAASPRQKPVSHRETSEAASKLP